MNNQQNPDAKQPLTLKRREFIGKASAALAAFTIVPRFVLGGQGYVAPSDKITLGFIGTGKQARGALASRFLPNPEVRILAGSDVDSQKLNDFRQKVEKVYAEQNDQHSYRGVETYEDFRALLSRKDIDAVVIATPDHWHAIPAIMAAEAGKDIYCEKPLSLTVTEGRAMVNAVRKHKRVLQTGSMQRSSEQFHRAAELVRNGYIGDIKKITVSVGGPPESCNQPAQPVPDYLNWDLWLGPAAYTPYNSFFAPPITEDVWANWRQCEYFGGGMMTDWGAHMFDIAQWALGMDDSGPVEVIPPDGKEYPVLTYRYKNGIPMVREDFGKGNAVRFEGTSGVIEVSRQFLNLPDNLQNHTIKSNEVRLYKSTDHYADWISCIRNRFRPICDVEKGHRTATVCNIGNIAYKLGRPLQWNPKREKFKKDAEANALLSRPMREPWQQLITANL
jgi:predicted dehydrogenase